jgi:hypothetical protein
MLSSMKVASNCGLLVHVFFLAEGFFKETFLFCGVTVPTRGSSSGGVVDFPPPFSSSPSSPPPCPSAIITKIQSSFSLKCSPIFYVLRTSPRIIVLDLQSAKIISRFLHPLISPKTLSMHRNNISFFISVKFTQINSFFQLHPSIQTRT